MVRFRRVMVTYNPVFAMPVMCSLFQLSNRMCSLWLSSAKMLCSLWQLPVFLIPDMCSLFWFSKMLCSLWLFSHQFVCSLWKFAVFAILCSLFLFSCVRYGRHPPRHYYWTMGQNCFWYSKTPFEGAGA